MFAPLGYSYNKKGNLILSQLEKIKGTRWEPYAPKGYTFTRQGYLKRNNEKRWREEEFAEEAK